MSTGDAGGPSAPTDREVWRWLGTGAVLLVLVFFLWTLRELLNPFLLFWALVGVLIPFRRTRAFWPVVGTAAALTGVWLLRETGFLLAPFVLAFVLAYILNPAVGFVARGRVSRSAAIALLCLPFLGAGALAVVFGVPWVGAQVAEVSERAPAFLRQAADWVEGMGDRVAALDLPFVDGTRVAAFVRDLDADTVVAFLQEHREVLVERVWEGVLGLGQGVLSVATVVGYVVLTPVLTFYLLRDYDRLLARMEELAPEGRGDALVEGVREYDRLLSAYLRGQVTVSVLVGAMTALGLWIAGIPYALLLGIIVAVFNVVPYLGVVLSLIPALVIAVTTGDPLVSLVKVAVVYTVAQSIESAVFSPRIVGESTGLHPVWILLALAVGGFFFGFVGLLLAVPGAVAVRLLAGRLLERYRETGRLGGAMPAAEPAGGAGAMAGSVAQRSGESGIGS